MVDGSWIVEEGFFSVGERSSRKGAKSAKGTEVIGEWEMGIRDGGIGSGE